MTSNNSPRVSVKVPRQERGVAIRVIPPDTRLYVIVTTQGEALEVKVSPKGCQVEVSVEPIDENRDLDSQETPGSGHTAGQSGVPSWPEAAAGLGGSGGSSQAASSYIHVEPHDVASFERLLVSGSTEIVDRLNLDNDTPISYTFISQAAEDGRSDLSVPAGSVEASGTLAGPSEIWTPEDQAGEQSEVPADGYDAQRAEAELAAVYQSAGPAGVQTAFPDGPPASRLESGSQLSETPLAQRTIIEAIRPQSDPSDSQLYMASQTQALIAQLPDLIAEPRADDESRSDTHIASKVLVGFDPGDIPVRNGAEPAAPTDGAVSDRPLSQRELVEFRHPAEEPPLAPEPPSVIEKWPVYSQELLIGQLNPDGSSQYPMPGPSASGVPGATFYCEPVNSSGQPDDNSGLPQLGENQRAESGLKGAPPAAESEALSQPLSPLPETAPAAGAAGPLTSSAPTASSEAVPEAARITAEHSGSQIASEGTGWEGKDPRTAPGNQARERIEASDSQEPYFAALNQLVSQMKPPTGAQVTAGPAGQAPDEAVPEDPRAENDVELTPGAPEAGPQGDSSVTHGDPAGRGESEAAEGSEIQAPQDDFGELESLAALSEDGYPLGTRSEREFEERLSEGFPFEPVIQDHDELPAQDIAADGSSSIRFTGQSQGTHDDILSQDPLSARSQPGTGDPPGSPLPPDLGAPEGNHPPLGEIFNFAGIGEPDEPDELDDETPAVFDRTMTEEDLSVLKGLELRPATFPYPQPPSSQEPSAQLGTPADPVTERGFESVPAADLSEDPARYPDLQSDPEKGIEPDQEQNQSNFLGRDKEKTQGQVQYQAQPADQDAVTEQTQRPGQDTEPTGEQSAAQPEDLSKDQGFYQEPGPALAGDTDQPWIDREDPSQADETLGTELPEAVDQGLAEAAAGEFPVSLDELDKPGYDPVNDPASRTKPAASQTVVLDAFDGPDMVQGTVPVNFTDVVNQPEPYLAPQPEPGESVDLSAPIEPSMEPEIGTHIPEALPPRILYIPPKPVPKIAAPEASTAVIVNYLEDNDDSMLTSQGAVGELADDEDMDIDLMDAHYQESARFVAKPMIPVPKRPS
jgi:hypothetical protein